MSGARSRAAVLTAARRVVIVTLVCGAVATLPWLATQLNPYGDGAMIRHFERNLDALADPYSLEFVSDQAEESWLRNLRISRTNFFRGARVFEVHRFTGLGMGDYGDATRGYAFYPDISESRDLHVVEQVCGLTGICDDRPGHNYFRHLVGHWYLYWIRPAVQHRELE